MAAHDEQPGEEQVSYFVTVRTFNCRRVFHEDKSAATLVELIEGMRRERGFKKYGYVVLPDHYHVLFGGGPSSAAIADTIRAINRAAERFLELPDDGQPLWEDETDVLVIYSARARFEKLNYIHHKPVLCGIVQRAEDYAYSSAGFYFRRYGKTEF
ncbi:MAG TPA: transposase [Planctomycetota bacterium]|nr:transposase [Planctomycetota bacterium]HRR80812.1 transposase [Planctomycetota bacterium]HRT96561.1 transposase [Planctomycetota bacterium]